MTDTGIRKPAFEMEADGLARRFRNPLLRYFRRRLGSEADAEDLTQEVFVRLLRRSSGEPIEKIGAFLFATAGNLMRDHVQARRTRPQETPSSDDDEISDISVEDCAADRVLIGRERLAEVMARLDQLPLRTREVFLLFRVERMRQRDIASAMGISVSAVEKHIARASAHLVQQLLRSDAEA
jgi:RNA polymerase sigma-70 factor (ECF subfamily)